MSVPESSAEKWDTTGQPFRLRRRPTFSFTATAPPIQFVREVPTDARESPRAHVLRRIIPDRRANPDGSLTLVNVVTYGRAARMPLAVGS